MIIADYLAELHPEILQAVDIISRLDCSSCLVLLDEEVYGNIFIFSYSPYAARSGDAFIVSIILISAK